ncbi:MAG: DUF72 domain-containing protein [Bacteroidia bacterium]
MKQVDFGLPAIPDDSIVNLAVNKNSQMLKIHIGLPMWGNKDWTGKLYPKGTKAGEFLAHYARAFNGIELNSTHYRIPNADTVARWSAQVADNPDFRFSPKLPQFISHRFQLINCEAPLMEFCEAIRGFGTHLGCSFVQLPPNFGPEKLGNIRAFLEIWPKDLPIAFEFREAGWFQNQRLIPEARELLQAFRAGSVITDVAGRRDVCHLDLCNDSAMLRFVGNGLVQTDFERADRWVSTLKEFSEAGLHTAYLFIHEPDDAFAPEMAVYFIQKLNEQLGTILHTPVLGEFPGAQMSLF